MIEGEAHGAVEKSTVEKIEVLEWGIGWIDFPRIRFGGMGKRRGQRISESLGKIIRHGER
jgi:hypothetical protein